PGSKLWAEIDMQLVGRLPRLVEVDDFDDAADTDVHLLKVGVGKACCAIVHLLRNMTRTAAWRQFPVGSLTDAAVRCLIGCATDAEQRAQALGALATVTKPVDVDTLLDIVRRYCA